MPDLGQTDTFVVVGIFCIEWAYVKLITNKIIILLVISSPM